MCLLTYLPAGIDPDLTALETGAAYNGDGHGFAVIADHHLIVGKGLDADEVLTRFARARREHPGGAALFHSRLRTHGRTTVENCHPFPVGADPRTVIAHNGMLPANVRPGPGDDRSDTRIAAEDYLPRLGSLHLRRTRLRIERWMGPGNLMVLLTVDRRYRHHAYLFHEQAGIWDQGIWYSNDSYRPARPRWARWPHDDPTPPWDPTSPDRYLSGVHCASCRTITDVEESWCLWCQHCWACGQPPQYCDCWTPAALTRPRPTTGAPG